jgi:hypothetical protein
MTPRPGRFLIVAKFGTLVGDRSGALLEHARETTLATIANDMLTMTPARRPGDMAPS